MSKPLKLSRGRKEEIKKKMLDFRAEAEEGNKYPFIRMTQNERFKIGKQWKHDDFTYNEAHGKFALTINEVLPIILDIAGTQQENPLDYKVRNVKGGTQVVAEILSALTKNIMDKSDGEEEASRGFEAGVTTGRGYLHLDIDYSNDPLNGDLVIKELDPFMVLPDPTCKTYDYNEPKGGAKYLWVDEWIDKTMLETRLPGRKEEFRGASFDPVPQGRFAGLMSFMFGGGGPNLHLKDDYRHYDENSAEAELNSNVTKQTNNYRVSTCWWREWKPGVYVQRLDDPLNYLALTDKKVIREAKEKAETNENIRIIEKDRDELPITIPQLNRTEMLGDLLLTHTEDPFDGITLFMTSRFAPYFDHGYEYPPVENLIGPQKLINYAYSTMVNLLKQLANTGWIIGRGSQKKIQELEEHGSKDGLILNKSDYGTIEKIVGTPLDTGFHIVTETSKQNMREISQVSLTQPMQSRPESGKAKQIDELRTQRTKGIIFRNWNQTNKSMARVMIELIRNTDIFSDDEIMAIVDAEDLIDDKILDQAKGIVINQLRNQLRNQGKDIPEPPKQLNPIRVRNATPEIQAQYLDVFQAQVDKFQKFISQVEQTAIPIAREITLKLLRKRQQGRYGIKVDTSPMAPTVRMVKRVETLALDKQLIEGGRLGISRRKLIETSDVPDKEEIIAEEPQPVKAGAA